ncbi:MAG: hypothetical protein J6K16_06410 [Alphaproteobacteria bacterium]|nr:hypothetical protein [Alphaproteobacteria bacterium]
MNNIKSAGLCVNVILVIFVAFAMFGNFIIKNSVESLEKELKSINESINNDVKSIHILKAEWSHLNSPERLRRLAAKHIELEPAKAEQIINYAALPFEYEDNADPRKATARRNISNIANENRELRRLAKAQR